MASLEEPFRLFAGEIDIGSLYIEGHSSSNCIIITTGNRHISVYDVGDSQPQNSWTIMSGHLLTRSTVLNPIDERYAAIVDNKIVRLWSKNEATLTKSKKITMSKPVHGLVTRGQLEPLVVFTDGSLAWLHHTGEPISNPCLSDRESLAWVDAILLKEDELVLMMVSKMEKEKANKKVRVFVIKRKAGNVTGRQFEESVTWTSRTCTSLQISGTQAAALSIDKSGRLTEMHLTGPSFGRSTKLHPVPLGGAGNAATAICSLGPSHLAICGARSPSGAPCIGIWDKKFGILQAWKPLPWPMSEAGDEVCLRCQGNRVALAGRKGMYVYSFACRQSTLGAALGKFSTTCLNISHGPALDSVSDLLTKLADPQQTKRQKAFSMVFKLLIVEVDKKGARVYLLDIQHQVAAVLRRIVCEKEFWAREELHLLIKRGMIPGSMLTEVMGELTSHGELALIHSCLTNVPDIPEVALTNCLQYVLRTDESMFEKFENETKEKTKKNPSHKSEKSPFYETKARFVRLLLLQPFNDVFLEGQLKHIDFQSCLNLLQYLYYLLETSMVVQKSGKTLSIFKVVDWLNMLLDAHFTQVILSPEARPLLINLHEVVEQQVQFYKELVGLESILAQIKEKCSLPQKQHPGLYNIHVLHIF